MRDLIDRQAAIEAMGVLLDSICEGQAIEALKELPSAEKRGRWIDWELNEKYGWYFANCSECGCQIDVHENRGYYSYCPNCGAKMGETNETD